MNRHRILSASVASLMTLSLAIGIAAWRASSTDKPLKPVSPALVAPASFSFMPLPKPHPLPPLHFNNAQGRELSLGDFRGRVVLLNLWATWCVPCRKEMPALNRLEATLGGPDFEVVALSIDRRGLPAVRPFYRALGLTALHIYLDPSGTATSALAAPGIPTSVLVDRAGRELGRVIGAEKWDSPAAEAMIRKYLDHRSPIIRARGTRPTSSALAKAS